MKMVDPMQFAGAVIQGTHPVARFEEELPKSAVPPVWTWGNVGHAENHVIFFDLYAGASRNCLRGCLPELLEDSSIVHPIVDFVTSSAAGI